MDKAFFSEIDAKRDAYVARTGVPDALIEIAFHNGRTLVLDRVVEAADSWLVVEGRDQLDEEKVVAFATPYHQISSVQFVPRAQRLGRAGF